VGIVARGRGGVKGRVGGGGSRSRDGRAAFGAGGAGGVSAEVVGAGYAD
jgi:hypothetical protein